MQGLCCCTAAFRLCYLDNVTAAGTSPPTLQDTGNPIICLLMCGNFTLFFLRLWPEGEPTWKPFLGLLFIYLPGKCPLTFFFFFPRNRYYRKVKLKCFFRKSPQVALNFSAEGSCRPWNPHIMCPSSLAYLRYNLNP